jgi:hypothetical protein
MKNIQNNEKTENEIKIITQANYPTPISNLKGILTSKQKSIELLNRPKIPFNSPVNSTTLLNYNNKANLIKDQRLQITTSQLPSSSNA